MIYDRVKSNRVLSLIGKVPKRHLGRYRFESGRTRIFIIPSIPFFASSTWTLLDLRALVSPGLLTRAW